MSKLDRQLIDQARGVRDALNKVFDDYESGRLKIEPPQIHLPELPGGLPNPSGPVKDLADRNDAARDAYQAQIDRANAASAFLESAAELAPLAAALLPLLLCLLVIVGLPLGCRAQAPVQVGPTSQPFVESTAPLLDSDIASPSAAIDAGDAPTTQEANAGPVDQHAGGDNRNNSIPITISGSGWPLVAMMACSFSLAYLYLRSERSKGRLRVSYETLGENSLAVADAIKHMGPGPQRDRLLSDIKGGLFNRRQWNDHIGTRRVHRTTSSAGPP